MKRKRLSILLIFFITILILGFVKYKRTEYWMNSKLHIPTKEYIKENGYPVNDSGMTYGPDIKEETDLNNIPDLLLVENEKGKQGYVKTDELFDDGINNLDEAIKNMEKDNSHSIPMYLQDGKTVIGEFKVGH